MPNRLKKVGVWRPSFISFTRRFFAIILAFVLSCSIVILDDDDAFFLLIASAKDTAGGFMGSFSGLFSSDSSGTGESGDGTTTTVTGVNLNLIDQISVNKPYKGYAKELLSFLRDMQNGAYTSGNSGPLLASFLGMWIVEVGNDNSHALPDFYFDSDDWVENSANYSFAGFTSNSKTTRSEIDSSSGISIIQWINDGESGFADDRSAASVNPVNNTRKYTPDVRFLPDLLKYWTSMYTATKSVFGCSQAAASMLTDLYNNRGDYGMRRYVFGCYFNSEGYVNESSISSHKKVAKSTVNELYQSFSWVLESDEVTIESHSSNTVDFGRGFALAINSDEGDNWFIDEKAYNTIINAGYVSNYQKMFGDSKSASEIKSELARHVTTIEDSINQVNGTNLSASDISKAYGWSCSNGSYSLVSDKYGLVWHVSETKDPGGIYENTYSDGSNPYIISTFDGINFAHMFSASVGGVFEYASILKTCGVDSVDPTNPSTFISSKTTSSSSSDSTWTGSLDSYLKGMHINSDALTEDRKVILNVAASIAKSDQWGYYEDPVVHSLSSLFKKYSVTYSDGAVKSYKMDCSAFVYWVYYFSGFDEYLSTSAYNTTSWLSCTELTKIEFSDMKPGDIFLKSGHIEIYLGGTTQSAVYTIGAHGKNGYTFERSISASGPKNMSIYGCYRFKYIDKGKRGDVTDISKYL